MSKIKSNASNIHSKFCFGCGSDNPSGLGLNIQFDDCIKEVRGIIQIPEKHCSIKGLAHGGIIATILDEIQGALCQYLGHPVMTHKIEVTYTKIAHPKQDIRIRAWLSKTRKRRLYTRATLHNEKNELIASSRASFYIFSEKLWRKLWPISQEEADKVIEELKMAKEKTKGK